MDNELSKRDRHADSEKLSQCHRRPRAKRPVHAGTRAGGLGERAEEEIATTDLIIA